jgi:hypothetical protein
VNEEEAKTALAEYLGRISPMFKQDNELTSIENYAPLIEEKLTEEKLQTLNKKDRMFIIVFLGNGNYGLDTEGFNYWIASPFQNGFVFFENPSEQYSSWVKIESKWEKLKRIISRMGRWHSNKTIGDMLNEAFSSSYTYYLLNPSALAPSNSRTLNFSRRGFL